MPDYEQTLIDSNPTILDFDFTRQLLALDLTFGNKRSTWYQAGFVTPLVNVDGNFYEGTAIKLRFDKQLLEIPYLTYRLRFEPVDWARDIKIEITQLLSSNYQTAMGVNFSVQPRATGDVIDEIKTTGLTASQSVMVANADRAEGGTIYNRTNKNMYVKWGTVAATTADLLVTAGSNIDVPDSYTGAAQAICANGATGQILTQTVSYV
jgi:hypothetical protein